MSCLNAWMSEKVSILASPLTLPPSGYLVSKPGFSLKSSFSILSWLVTISCYSGDNNDTNEIEL